MCGIAGIITLSHSVNAMSSCLKAMNEKLIHRGPDDEGIWISSDKAIGFAHRRLSIIDLTSHGHQPMQSADEKYILTFNGEIYNYKELKIECEKLGSHFKTHTDTEVIIESYRHWGMDAITKLRGMWAFALLDQEKQRVILSRDPFAIKPLYYSFYEGNLYFASEPQGLTVLGEYFSEKDPITMEMFRTQGYLERDEWTFYKNIKRFPHAHNAIINLRHRQSHLSFHRYWSPPTEINHNISFKDAVNRVRELFEESVALHLRSDVPLGSCLSGGIDSSAIVCVGSKLLKGKSFSTFTTEYPYYKDIDESAWAKQVISQTKANSYFIAPTKESFLADLDHVINVQGEPFGSMSIYAQYCVFKRIAQTNVKVVLDGQGSDEMLAGYLGFTPIYFQSLATSGKIFSLMNEIISFRGTKLPNYTPKQYIRYALKQMFPKAMKNHIVKQSSCSTAEIKDEMTYRLEKLMLQPKSFEEQLQALLCETNIPQLLRYEDRNSMAFSIESRVPFLNIELVNFILSLPAKYRIRNGYTKAVFRDAMKDIIPDNIRLRRDKMGFPAPEIQWLKDCFNIEASTTGSQVWREFILNRWITNTTVIKDRVPEYG